MYYVFGGVGELYFVVVGQFPFVVGLFHDFGVWIEVFVYVVVEVY